ncbi:MAG: SDR family NAD(P)-dependent oxidoreductase [Solirubrobacteraceae bacterium]
MTGWSECAEGPTAPTVLSGAVLPGRTAAGWGRIVNISSGVVGNPEMMVGGTVYAATKAALEAHTRNAARELLCNAGRPSGTASASN